MVSKLWVLGLDSSMATPNIYMEKFNLNNDFNMWKIKMEALLITHGLRDAIKPVSKMEGKETPSSKTPEELAKINKKTVVGL